MSEVPTHAVAESDSDEIRPGLLDRWANLDTVLKLSYKVRAYQQLKEWLERVESGEREAFLNDLYGIHKVCVEGRSNDDSLSQLTTVLAYNLYEKEHYDPLLEAQDAAKASTERYNAALADRPPKPVTTAERIIDNIRTMPLRQAVKLWEDYSKRTGWGEAARPRLGLSRFSLDLGGEAERLKNEILRALRENFENFKKEVEDAFSSGSDWTPTVGYSPVGTLQQLGELDSVSQYGWIQFLEKLETMIETDIKRMDESRHTGARDTLAKMNKKRVIGVEREGADTQSH